MVPEPLTCLDCWTRLTDETRSPSVNTGDMSDNCSGASDALPAAAVARYNFPALVFGVVLIVIIIGGNVLVCLSVYLEKALKTTTNYFIVSLAFADLLLAVLVLPLFVYAEVRIREVRGHWWVREFHRV